VRILILTIILIFLLGCGAKNDMNIRNNHALYQVSTIQALLAGLYDGDKKVTNLHAHGDFGLGTFDGINGEMIVYEGNVYQVRSNGKVSIANENEGVPFASVHFFLPEQNNALDNIATFDALKTTLNNYKQCNNYPCAFKIHGSFEYVKTRSEPKASKPYPPLADYISNNQTFFNANDINGTIIGYKLPPSFATLNVTGYHFHFLSDDKRFGGHLLEVSLKNAIVELDVLYDFELALLRTKAFDDSDLKTKEGDLDKVEK